MKMQVDLVKVLAICLILLSLMLLGGCQASTPAPAAVIDASVPAADFDYEQAAEVSAARWQAMARFYEQAELLTRPQTVGFVTAINPADQKFFNAGYGISVRANSDVLSAADSADRKFFNAGVPYSAPATIHPADRKFFYTEELYDTVLTIQPAGRKSFYDGALYPVGH